MNVELKPFNPVVGLQSREEIAQYLTECYEDDDPNTFITALGYVAKHKGMSEIAKDTGLNRESLYKALSGNKQPRWDTVQRVMKSLNISLRTTVV